MSILYIKSAQWQDKEHTKFSVDMLTDYFDTLTTYNLTTEDAEYQEILDKGFTIAEFPEAVEPTDEEVKNAIVVAVQELLDSVAQSRGYDNGFTCASYYNSSVNTFRNEAHAYVEWRDKVWQTCYVLLDSYLAGDISRPTVEDVMSKLPVISWVTDRMAEEKQKQEETNEQA